MVSELTEAVRALAIGGRSIERSLDDMTLAQYRVLTHVALSPERASRIAEMAAVSRPSLTGLLDGLEAKGWVQRVDVAGDRRGVRLELTPEGAVAMKEAQRSMNVRLDLVLRAATPEDRAAAVAGLRALGRALEAHAATIHRAAPAAGR